MPSHTELVGVQDLPPTVHLDRLDGVGLEPTLPFTRIDQMRNRVEIIVSKNVKIAVITNGLQSQNLSQDRSMQMNITAELNRILSGSKTHV